MIQAAGRRKIQGCGGIALEHAEHDGADKGEGEISGDNAQFADESHGRPPWFTSLSALTSKLANRSRRKKSALLSITTPPRRGAAGNVVKES